MSNILQPGSPTPKIDIHLKFDVDQIYHLWASIMDYQRYRDGDKDPTINVLPPDHPLILITHTLHGMLDHIILEGMKKGWYVAPLLDIKTRIRAATEGGEGEPISE